MFVMSLTALIVSIVAIVTRSSSTPISSATITREKPHVNLAISGIKIEEHIYSLGEKVLPDSDIMVQGLAFLHFTNETFDVKRSVKSFISDPAMCFGFLAQGAKWKETENWLFNPTNTQNLNHNYLMQAANAGVNQWNSKLNNPVFGTGTMNTVVYPSLNAPDSKNVIAFGTISTPGVLAVTYTWGIFNGPVDQRRLYEWDMVFDQSDWLWGDASLSPSRYDFQAILTHETGHAAGLSDMYDTACFEQTMFGSSSYGDIQKRTLNVGDINGIQTLYPSTIGLQGQGAYDDDSSQAHRVVFSVIHFIILYALFIWK